MDIKVLKNNLSVCKLPDASKIDLSQQFYFIGRTDEEISLVCDSDKVPENATDTDGGWRAFRIQGVLDFSLVGILSKIAGLLAENKISIFAVSTYNTDYVLIKSEKFDSALSVLKENGYNIV